MAWWSFGKKTKKSKPKLVNVPATSDIHPHPQTPASAPPTRSTVETDKGLSLAASPGPATQSPSRRQSLDKSQLEEPYELHPAERRESQDDDITALPGAPQHHEFDSGPHLRNIEQLRHSSSKSGRGNSDSISLSKRKSSKRYSRDTRSREDEPRSLPIAIPKQSSGSLFRKDSTRRLSRQDPTASNVSLPRAASLRSGMTGIQEHHRFDVGGLDIFSARPKIRYSYQQSISAPSRAPSRRSTRPVSRPDPHNPDDRSPIDELADDYDATTIRELMERDKRRNEQRHRLQAEKAQRRLERQARRERDAAGLPADSGESSSRALEGLALHNIRTEPESPTVVRRTSQKGKQVARSNDSVDPFSDPEPATVTEPEQELEPPSAGPVRPTLEAIRTSTPPPTTPTKSPILATLPAADANRSMAELADRSPSTIDRKTSQAGNKRQSALAALFRRSKRGSQDYESQKEEPHGSFSNTSRESMTRQQIPVHLREQPSLSGAMSATRTRSKFWEDLPESPAAGPGHDPSEALPANTDARALAAQATNIAADSDPSAEPASGPLSASVASIGSEGSWLSGSKPPRKRESRGNVATPDPVAERPETAESEEVWADAQAFRRPSLAKHRANLDALGMHQEDADQSRTESSGQITSGDEESLPASPYDLGGETPQVEVISHARHARQVSSGSAKLLDIPARTESKRKVSSPTDATSSSPISHKG